jgi:hypothetical protein
VLARVREWAEWLGTTPSERATAYPAETLLDRVDLTLYRAVDVGAPVSLVWRWLCQLRVAPYSYDWIDNLGRRSPRALTPGLEDLAVGQRAMTIFEIAAFVPEESLTLRQTSRLARRVWGDVAVTYVVRPLGPGRSRLVGVVCAQDPPPSRLVCALGDAVMMRKQLRTLAGLAERDARYVPGRGGVVNQSQAGGS